MHPHRRSTRKRRASVMVEFALLLPMFLFFIMFSIDAGRLMLLRAELQDATQQAARAGAQVGGATYTGAASRHAFDAAIELAPGLDAPKVTNFEVVEGGRCTVGQPYVTIRTEYDASLVTPGLGALLRLVSSNAGTVSSTWQLRAVSTARCEVVVS
jgi:Flp pilus assembly protein TadG